MHDDTTQQRGRSVPSHPKEKAQETTRDSTLLAPVLFGVLYIPPADRMPRGFTVYTLGTGQVIEIHEGQVPSTRNSGAHRLGFLRGLASRKAGFILSAPTVVTFGEMIMVLSDAMRVLACSETSVRGVWGWVGSDISGFVLGSPWTL